MNIQIHNVHIEVSDEQRNYVNEKIENISKYERRIADEATIVRVDIEKNKNKASKEHVSMHITLFVPHAVIRAEVTGITIEESVDKAVEKIKKQIERYKTKKHRRTNEGEWIPQSTLENITDLGQEEFRQHQGLGIMKRKKFEHLKPMHEDEALEQMELLGHDFFAFLNADTNLFSVLYARMGEEGYGLIELETSSV